MDPPPPTTTSPVQEPVFDPSLFTKTAERKPSSSAKSFLDLPPELRLEVYKYITTDLITNHRQPPPGARVISNLALALTCRLVCEEHLDGAIAAQNRQKFTPISDYYLPDSNSCSLDIRLSRNCTGTQVLEKLGIDIIDRFDHVLISVQWIDGWGKGGIWTKDQEEWEDQLVRYQIDQAGGPLAFGWRDEPEAFYRRATFEKAMERADSFMEYQDSVEIHAARDKHTAWRLHFYDGEEDPSMSEEDQRCVINRTETGRSFGMLNCPEADELGPISFKFASAAQKLAVEGVEITDDDSASGNLHNEG